MEDTRELIASTHSYLKEDWSCISCKKKPPAVAAYQQEAGVDWRPEIDFSD